MTTSNPLTVVVARPERLSELAVVPAPRRVSATLSGALLELRRAAPGATLLLVDPPADTDWAALRADLTPLRTRLIVTGAHAPGDARRVPNVQAAVALLGVRGAVSVGEAPAPHLTLIGASTGGPRALSELLDGLRPSGSVVLAQHLSAAFSENLTQWLGTLTDAPVRAAHHGDPLVPGTIHVASGTSHVTVQGRALHLHAGVPGREHLPSIDRLFLSARHWPPGALTAVLLSGMGDDGAEGLSALHAQGVTTAVQDPRVAAAPSMPREALARVTPTVTADLPGLRALLERRA